MLLVRIPSFAEAKAEFWRVQAILCARGLGGAEERRVREQLEAKSVADNFDARVHRRSVGHRPPPNSATSGSRRSKPRETTICRKSKMPCLEITCRGSASCRPRARSRTARSTSWTDRR